MLDTQARQHITYFVGTEVEHTIAYGMKTLFVVGTPALEEIVKNAQQNNCKHVYLGTSQSFNPTLEDGEYEQWGQLIFALLAKEFFVTLDFDSAHASNVLEYGFDENNRFIAMISVKLPYINQFNYNATLKLDDSTWGHSNPGVWTHQLHDLMAKDKYTYWDQYTQDTKL